MTPQRRTPQGLETANTRSTYRYHPHADWSCELDSESLPFGCGGWQSDLLDDMRSRPAKWLALHYPELTFSIVPTKKQTKGHAYWEQCGKSYRVADWRTA